MEPDGRIAALKAAQILSSMDGLRFGRLNPLGEPLLKYKHRPRPRPMNFAGAVHTP
jgi:hypothetical protein